MARDYYGPELRRVFLMDGDAIIIKTEELLQILRKLYDRFPMLEKVTLYAGPKSTLSKTPEEFGVPLAGANVMADRCRGFMAFIILAVDRMCSSQSPPSPLAPVMPRITVTLLSGVDWDWGKLGATAIFL